MEQYEEKEMRLLRALIQRKGMQHILDTAAEVFENPVFVCDLGYKVLGRSGQRDAEDPFWTYLDDHSFGIPEHIAQIMRSGDFAKVYASDAPRIGKYEFAEYPFLAARIRDGSHVMGHICIYGKNRHFLESDQTLLILLCKVISYEMLYRGVSMSYEVPYYALLTDLLEGKIQDEREVTTQLRNLNLTFPKAMVLMLVDFHNTAVQATIHYLREYLTRSMPRVLSIVYRERMMLLAPESELNDHMLEDALLGYAANIDYQVGVSDPVRNVMNLNIYWEQAETAIQVSNRLQLSDRLCLYSRLKIYQLLLYAQKETDLRFLCDPVVLEMQEYDRCYHTDYLGDLELYLSCGKSISRTAQRACVHKNSMYYRISKMQELFPLTLEDEDTCFTLRLSFQILKLLSS